jgi:hypothetical protein
VLGAIIWMFDNSPRCLRMKGGVLRALPPEGPLASRRKGPEQPGKPVKNVT